MSQNQDYRHRSSYYKHHRGIIIGGVMGLACAIIIIMIYVRFDGSVQKFLGSNTIPVDMMADKNAPSQTYFAGSAKVVTSSEEKNLGDKLKEEGKIQGAQFTFTSKGFDKIVGDEIFRTSTMVQMEIDASSTGLPDGTELTLSIPSANVHSSIIVPGRYRYLIAFNKGGEQKMTLRGDGLTDNQIVYTFQVR